MKPPPAMLSGACPPLPRTWRGPAGPAPPPLIPNGGKPIESSLRPAASAQHCASPRTWTSYSPSPSDASPRLPQPRPPSAERPPSVARRFGAGQRGDSDGLDGGTWPGKEARRLTPRLDSRDSCREAGEAGAPRSAPADMNDGRDGSMTDRSHRRVATSRRQASAEPAPGASGSVADGRRYQAAAEVVEHEREKREVERERRKAAAEEKRLVALERLMGRFEEQRLQVEEMLRAAEDGSGGASSSTATAASPLKDSAAARGGYPAAAGAERGAAASTGPERAAPAAGPATASSAGAAIVSAAAKQQSVENCGKILEEFARERAIWDQKMLTLQGAASSAQTIEVSGRLGTAASRPSSAAQAPIGAGDAAAGSTTGSLAASSTEQRPATHSSAGSHAAAATEERRGETPEALHASGSERSAEEEPVPLPAPRRSESRPGTALSTASQRPSLATPSRQQWAAERLRRKKERVKNLRDGSGTPGSSASNSRAGTPLVPDTGAGDEVPQQTSPGATERRGVETLPEDCLAVSH